MTKSDQGSVAKDDWDQHWAAFTESTLKNPASRYRNKLIFSYLRECERTRCLNFLDIGCGQGDFALEVSRFDPKIKILGFDISKAGIDIARRRVPSADFHQRDLMREVSVDGKYKEWAQFAVCSEVLEHLDQPDVLLSQIAKYLAPSAQLVITVPGGPKSYFDKHIGHRCHYTRQSLRRLAMSAGYQVEEVLGSGFPFLNIYRMVVILRGKNLIGDLSSRPRASALVAMKIFDYLFRLNTRQSPWGWQMVALARKVA